MSDDRSNGYQRGKAVLGIFRRGAEFARDLLDENTQLRERLQNLERRQNAAVRNPVEWEKLRYELLSQISVLETENQDMLERLSSKGYSVT